MNKYKWIDQLKLFEVGGSIRDYSVEKEENMLDKKIGTYD